MKNIIKVHRHYVVSFFAAVLVLLGLLLMMGEASNNEVFCSDIFSARRIRIAPLLCLAGYLMLIPAIVCGHKEVTGKDGRSRD